MKDGIIKNTGNSRMIQASLPASYEEFRRMAAAGQLPLDLLFNAAGWAQQPDFLNKANLLKDQTAAMYGLGLDGMPDNVLALLGQLYTYKWARRKIDKYIKKSAAEPFNVGAKIHLEFWYADTYKAVTNDLNETEVEWGSEPAHDVTLGNVYESEFVGKLQQAARGKVWTLVQGNYNQPKSPVFLSTMDATFSRKRLQSDPNNWYVVSSTGTSTLSVAVDYAPWGIISGNESDSYPHSGVHDKQVFPNGDFTINEYKFLDRTIKFILEQQLIHGTP